jgi:hypothetical protein
LSNTHEVNGCASVSLFGATAAIQGSVPLSITSNNDGNTTTSTGLLHHNNQSYKTSSYFCTNINDEVTNLSPIQLTIQQQNQFGPDATIRQSSIGVSQIITFQRYHFNIIDEYRAPYVHNTVAWTIQMESLSSSSESTSSSFSFAEDSDEHNNNTHRNKYTKQCDILTNRMNRVSLGLAWQLNRNVALKAVLYPPTSTSSSNSQVQGTEPSNDGITATTAILLKRWYYPRITCSILHKWTFHDPLQNRIFPTAQFAGIGIDIETGDDDHYYNNAVTKRGSNESDDEDMESPKLHPPTIAVLPKELYKLKQRR